MRESLSGYFTNKQRGWHEYRLTEAGKELYDVVLAIMYWSDRHLAGPDGPPLLLRHTTCDHDTHGVVVCAHCGEPLHPHEVDPRPEPGATERPVGRRPSRQRDSHVIHRRLDILSERYSTGSNL